MVRLDEAQRRLVHGALVEAHGEEVGDLMMAQYAVDWSDLATKGDISGLRAEVKGEISELRGEVRGEIGKLRGEIGEFRGEIKGEIGELRGEIGEFRGEMTGRIEGLQGEIKEAMAKQTRMFVAWNAALLLGVGATALGAAQLMS